MPESPLRPMRHLALAALAAAWLAAIAPAQPRQAIDSPWVGESGRITFRVLAPEARALALNAPWAGGTADSFSIQAAGFDAAEGLPSSRCRAGARRAVAGDSTAGTSIPGAQRGRLRAAPTRPQALVW